MCMKKPAVLTEGRVVRRGFAVSCYSSLSLLWDCENLNQGVSLLEISEDGLISQTGSGYRWWPSV